MSKVTITKSKLDALANAVSKKSGVATPITIDGMTAAVANIPTGDNTFVITLIWNDQTEMYEPDYTWSDICTAYYAGETVLSYSQDGLSEVFIEEYSFDPEWDRQNTMIYFSLVYWNDDEETYYFEQYQLTYEEYAQVQKDAVIFPLFDSPSVTYTPTESQQTDTITYDSTLGYNGIEEVNVTVNAIPSNYIGSGVARKSSSDLTASGATVTAPAGYYAANATKMIASGTAGTPTATKGNVSNHSVSITPSVTNTTGYITGSTKTGTAVTVSAGELVSGNKEITSNGTNIDVANYSTVSVAVSGGGGGKNVQVYRGYATVTSTSYTATAVTLTVAKTGIYNVSWMGYRNTTSGTSGSALYVNGSIRGSVSTTFVNTYGHFVSLTNQSFNQGDVLVVRARARSTQYVMGVGNLMIEEV